jgi:hypothetical protein
MPVCGDADVTPVVRSNELDECSRPAEWAVDPGLAGLLHHLEYDLAVGVRDNILDDGTVGGPFDTGDCSSLGLRSKVNPGSDHRSNLLRQESESHLLSCRLQVLGGFPGIRQSQRYGA